MTSPEWGGERVADPFSFPEIIGCHISSWKLFPKNVARHSPNNSMLRQPHVFYMISKEGEMYYKGSQR